MGKILSVCINVVVTALPELALNHLLACVCIGHLRRASKRVDGLFNMIHVTLNGSIIRPDRRKSTDNSVSSRTEYRFQGSQEWVGVLNCTAED
jgi:hypothetical protein